MTGTTDVQSTADLWFPTSSTTEPTVTGDGIGAVTAQQQDGGWRLFVSVSGSYRISVG